VCNFLDIVVNLFVFVVWGYGLVMVFEVLFCGVYVVWLTHFSIVRVFSWSILDGNFFRGAVAIPVVYL